MLKTILHAQWRGPCAIKANILCHIARWPGDPDCPVIFLRETFTQQTCGPHAPENTDEQTPGPMVISLFPLKFHSSPSRCLCEGSMESGLGAQMLEADWFEFQLLHWQTLWPPGASVFSSVKWECLPYRLIMRIQGLYLRSTLRSTWKIKDIALSIW